MELKIILSLLFSLLNVISWAQEAVVAVSKLNTVCICVDNQIEIAMPDVESKLLKVSIAEGQGELKKLENGKYLLHPSIEGYLTLKIEAGEIISLKKLVVKGIPSPTALLKGSMGGIISLELIRDAEKLTCTVNNFDYNVNCQITNYEVSFRKKNSNHYFLKYDIENNVFNNNVKAIFQGLNFGDIVIFKSIKARCPCDIKDREIGSMVFEIN